LSAYPADVEQRLAAIVESSEDAIIGQDMSGRITSWNRGAERLYGYRREEVLGKPVSLLIPPDHEDDFPTIMQRLRGGERVEHYETVRVARDGRRIDVSLTVSPVRDALGQIVGASKIARDISERKRVEQSLRARVLQQEAVAKLGEFALREHDLQSVLQLATSVLAGTLQVDYCKVLELLPDGSELMLRAGVGWRAGLVGTARVRSGAESQAGYTLQSNAPVIVADLAAERRFRGPALLFEHGVTSGMSCVIRGVNGRPWGVLGCHSRSRVSFTQDDVNFLSAMANIVSHAIHRDRSERMLRDADRRKDEFIATLSHELRNPLAPIRSALELLRMKNAGLEAERIYEIIERQTGHLVRLVDDLLEISRVERGLVELRRERVPLSEVLRNAVETSTPLIDAEGHRLEMEIPTEALWVDGDPLRLAQIFGNLLNNAARFTRRGGRIRIAAERMDGGAAVSVRDTGIGFAAHAKPRLFEMFQRNPQSSGLGIGLALARRLVEMHGGTIDASSEGEGKGAEFVVRLPLAEAPADESQPSAGQRREAGGGCRVLVADDNRDAAESLGMLLRVLGNEVMIAFDGEEAVALAQTFQPQVALPDVGMPKLDGYGAAR
jgi:PAS domain S-box-containing protein